MRGNRIALPLALAATVFGGALLGAGNALNGLLSQVDHDAHAHHHAGHHTNLPSILTMPAHCLFCIDGVSPQPVQQIQIPLALSCNTVVRPLLYRTAAAINGFHTLPRNRSPPVSLAV